jgi:hypothetical protein
MPRSIASVIRPEEGPALGPQKFLKLLKAVRGQIGSKSHHLDDISFLSLSLSLSLSQKKKKKKKGAKPRKYFPLDNFSLGLGRETRFKNRHQTPDNVIGFAMLDTSGVENMLGARVRTWKTR